MRSATGSQTLGSPSPSSYAFPDGKDTGADMPLAYRRGVDLAELSQTVYTQDKILTDALNRSLRQEVRNKASQPVSQPTSQPVSQPT